MSLAVMIAFGVRIPRDAYSLKATCLHLAFPFLILASVMHPQAVGSAVRGRRNGVTRVMKKYAAYDGVCGGGEECGRRMHEAEAQR